jgi:hypothetical protein
MRPSALLLSCIFLVTAAVAQDYPRAELFAGYSYASVRTGGTNFGFGGLESSLAVNATKRWAGELELSAYAHSESVPVLFGGSDVVNTFVYNALMGPRFTWKPVFFHVLVGPSLVTGSGGYSEAGFSAAAGLGAERSISRSFGVRISADYLRTYAQGSSAGVVRAAVGIVYRFGSAGASAAAQRSPTSHAVAVPALGIVLAGPNCLKILEVSPGGPAERAGLRAGDVINKINGDPVSSAADLSAEMLHVPPGGRIQVVWEVRGYWQTEATVILGP